MTKINKCIFESFENLTKTVRFTPDRALCCTNQYLTVVLIGSEYWATKIIVSSGEKGINNAVSY